MICRWDPNILNNQMGYVAGNLIFSKEEMERRHQLVRKKLQETGNDILMAQLCFPSASMAVDPYITWLAGTPGYKSVVTALLPKDGELILIKGSGPQGTQGKCSPFLGGKAAKELKKALEHVKKIAYCGLGRIEKAFYDFLMEECKNPELIDFSEEIDLMKAVKSQEELEAIANAAWIEDKLIEAAPSYLRPGRTQPEIQADIMKLLSDLNADMSIMSKLLISSGKNGEVNTFPTIAPKTRNHLCFPEYRLQKEDWVHVIYETPGIGGYYSETGRIFYFQEPCQEAQETWEMAVDVLEYQAGIVRPGRTLKEIREETNDYLESMGAQRDQNIFQIRGIGNLTVDRPQLYEWDEMKLAPNMALSLQPRYTKKDCTAIAMDTYVVTEAGKPYKFSRVPQKLIVL